MPFDEVGKDGGRSGGGINENSNEEDGEKFTEDEGEKSKEEGVASANGVVVKLFDEKGEKSESESSLCNGDGFEVGAENGTGCIATPGV